MLVSFIVRACHFLLSRIFKRPPRLEVAQPRLEMSRPIKFNVPEECRNFMLFRHLPPEIRQRIWATYLSTPGVHFVKLQTSDGSWRWTESHTTRSNAASTAAMGQKRRVPDEISRVIMSDAKPRERYDTCFIPVGPCPKADVSHYKTLRRQLATLSRTCVESRTVVKRLCNRPDTLRASDGQIISLGRSSDVVYLEYLPAHLYQGNGNLETIPGCPGLNHVKRLAVRFSHTWIPAKKSCACSTCKSSQARAHPGFCPAHLYQFMVRHLPNLEEFFFVDYFIVHKSKSELAGEEASKAQSSRSHRARFQAGNRLYHEANPDEWIMTKKVRKITKWLGKSFVRYAKESTLSLQENPEKVRFAVLACEWDIVPPIQRYGPASHTNYVQLRVPRRDFRKPSRLSLFDAEAATKSSEEWTSDEGTKQEFTFKPLFGPNEMASSKTGPDQARDSGRASTTVYRQLGRGSLYLLKLFIGKD